MVQRGMAADEAELQAGFRVFGSMPGAYGAGLQALIDEKGWSDKADLAEAYLVWGSYAYGAKASGTGARGIFEQRLRGVPGQRIEPQGVSRPENEELHATETAPIPGRCLLILSASRERTSLAASFLAIPS